MLERKRGNMLSLMYVCLILSRDGTGEKDDGGWTLIPVL
jgi:hypothetical protein